MNETETLKAEIERLTKDNAALKKALVAFAKHFGPLEQSPYFNASINNCYRLAREALKKDEARR